MGILGLMASRKLRIAVLLWCVVGVLCGCTLERIELREQEQERLEQFLKGKGDTVWKVREILYCPKRLGDTLTLTEADTVDLRYSLYALVSGSLQLLSSNIAEDLKSGNLPAGAPSAKDPMPFSLSDQRMVEGLRRGIALFAHDGGSGWLGIPSELGYGMRSVGFVPRNTPLVCYIECLRVR